MELPEAQIGIMGAGGGGGGDYLAKEKWTQNKVDDCENIPGLPQTFTNRKQAMEYVLTPNPQVIHSPRPRADVSMEDKGQGQASQRQGKESWGQQPEVLPVTL